MLLLPSVTKIRQFTRWFAISGAVGVFVAIVLYVLGSVPYIRQAVVHVSTFLCPEMSLGLTEPSSPAAVALLVGWVFGTNFVLYGTVGAALRGAWSRLRPA
jgi:hypothetical protein